MLMSYSQVIQIYQSPKLLRMQLLYLILFNFSVELQIMDMFLASFLLIETLDVISVVGTQSTFWMNVQKQEPE